MFFFSVLTGGKTTSFGIQRDAKELATTKEGTRSSQKGQRKGKLGLFEHGERNERQHGYWYYGSYWESLTTSSYDAHLFTILQHLCSIPFDLHLFTTIYGLNRCILLNNVLLTIHTSFYFSIVTLLPLYMSSTPLLPLLLQTSLLALKLLSYYCIILYILHHGQLVSYSIKLKRNHKQCSLSYFPH